MINVVGEKSNSEKINIHIISVLKDQVFIFQNQLKFSLRTVSDDRVLVVFILMLSLLNLKVA